MFSKKLKFISILIFTLLAGRAFAQGTVPAAPENVEATYEDGAVTVTWDAPADAADIASYRVYYSRKSILDNGGDYDDFSQTADASTGFVFHTPPYTGRTVYFSVLAVNAAGQESDGFTAEASVDVPAAGQQGSEQTGDSSSVSSDDASSATDSDSNDTLTLVDAQALSSTGVSLQFSDMLDPAQQLTSDTFVIVDESGSQLAILDVTFIGDTVTLITEPQTADRAYVIGILQDVVSAQGSGLSTSLPQIGFVGFREDQTVTQESSSSSSAAYVRPPPPPVDRTAPENPGSMNLKASLKGNGTYSVNAVWQGSINSARDLSGYRVYASVDGINFQPSSTTDPRTTSLRYGTVQPGTFGVRVTSIDRAGNESTGIQKVIDLPSSGIGLLGMIAASGAVAGQRYQRKRMSKRGR